MLVTAAALLVLLLPSLAAADLAPSPPPPLTIEGAPLVHTARVGGPMEATFVLHNTGTTPLRVRVESLVALMPRMRLPLRVTDASPAREVTVAPGARVSLRVSFAAIDGPAAREHEWTLELRAEVTGGSVHFARYVSGTTTVRRIPVPG
jgi:uncharacterized protein (DUF58 family)